MPGCHGLADAIEQKIAVKPLFFRLLFHFGSQDRANLRPGQIHAGKVFLARAIFPARAGEVDGALQRGLDAARLHHFDRRPALVRVFHKWIVPSKAVAAEGLCKIVLTIKCCQKGNAIGEAKFNALFIG